MTRSVSALTISRDTLDSACLLTVDGVLDSSAYVKLRNRVTKAALDGPCAVIVDVNALNVRTPSAWSVFISARWNLGTWPNVPIILVCADPGQRKTIARIGVARYVPVHATLESAMSAAADHARRARQRTRAELPASLTSLRQARAMVAEWLAGWSQAPLIPVATVIVNEFVQNVLQHTASAPVVALETDGITITVEVQDDSSTPPGRREDPAGGLDRVSGLAIIAAASRTWGSKPTPHGKTVWAVIGPENRL
ncbi:STAS domain-containing protein [Mycobacterium sp.]|uniref:STAS domain-containing protein n=1 Tax=Mycobacterium sp. TaxID=1785 RepID=UPI003D6BA94C